MHTYASYQPKHLKLCSIYMKSIAFYAKSNTHTYTQTERDRQRLCACAAY